MFIILLLNLTNTIWVNSFQHKVLLNIFQYLDFKTISTCAMLCKSFRKASSDGWLYKNVNLKVIDK